MHYKVLVVHDRNESIDNILEPFDENKEIETVISKEEIIAEQRKYIEYIKNNDYAEYLKDPKAYRDMCIQKEKGWAKLMNQPMNDPGPHWNFITNEFPKQLKWSDEECHQHGLRYYNKDDINSDGSVTIRGNRNGKWDWYVIGGRYNYDLVMKREVPNLHKGTASWTNAEDPVVPMTTNSTIKSNIDVAATRKLGITKHVEQWFYNFMEGQLSSSFAGRTPVKRSKPHSKPRSFRESIEDYVTAETVIEQTYAEIEFARTAPEHMRTTETKDVRKMITSSPLMTRCPYMFRELGHELNDDLHGAYGIVIDGKWIDRDGMDDETWDKHFNMLWDAIPDDKYVSIVDCHS